MGAGTAADKAQAENMLSWELRQDTRRKLILALESLKDVLQELSENESALKYAEYPVQTGK